MDRLASACPSPPAALRRCRLRPLAPDAAWAHRPLLPQAPWSRRGLGSGSVCARAEPDRSPDADGAGGDPDPSGASPSPSGSFLDDVNPLQLGRKSRQAVDAVWRLFTSLGGGGRDDDPRLGYEPPGPSSDFELPDARQGTRVLVVGATGRVGRVLVRKLLLRGYSVRALVRPGTVAAAAEAAAAAAAATGLGAGPVPVPELLPSKVEVVEGDLGDLLGLKAAVEGCAKVVCCSRARTLMAAELDRVEHRGVYYLVRRRRRTPFLALPIYIARLFHLPPHHHDPSPPVPQAKALQDHNHAMAQRRAGRSAKSKLTLVDFSRPGVLDRWRAVNAAEEAAAALAVAGALGPGGGPGGPARPAAATSARPASALLLSAQTRADLRLNDRGKAVFSGSVYARNGTAEARGPLVLEDGYDLGRYEGLVLRVCGDGKPYVLVALAQGRLYTARFGTRAGWSTTRLPFAAFGPANPADPPLDPSSITELGLRFENRKPRPSAGAAGGPAGVGSAGNGRVMETKEEAAVNAFRLEVDFIKALPSGEEPDIVLVSCAGAG